MAGRETTAKLSTRFPNGPVSEVPYKINPKHLLNMAYICVLLHLD